MLRMLACRRLAYFIFERRLIVLTWLLHESVDLVHGEVDHVGQVLVVDLLELVLGAPSSLNM